MGIIVWIELGDDIKPKPVLGMHHFHPKSATEYTTFRAG